MSRWWGLIFIVFISVGCPSKKPAVTSAPEVQIQLPKTPLEKSSENLDLQLLMQALSDMDAIYRELIRIAFDQKETDVSLFYKLQRALASEAGVKISAMSRLGCERYSLQFLPDKKNWQSLEVQEVCLKNPVVLMKAQKLSAERFQIKIFSEPLQRLLGLKATLAWNEAQCDFLTKSGRLNQFTCERLAQEKPQSNWVLLIQNLKGQQAEKIFQASLVGQLLENLAPLRKFEMTVPVSGPLKITETELYPAEPDPKTGVQPSALPPEKKSPQPQVMNPGQPLDINEQEYQKWISGEPILADQPGGIPGKKNPEVRDQEVQGVLSPEEAPPSEEESQEDTEATAESDPAEGDPAGGATQIQNEDTLGTESGTLDEGGEDSASGEEEVVGEPELPTNEANQRKGR